MNATRALLDSLMGKDRDATGDNAKRQSFKDDDVCKHHLCWECPHDMFVNQQGRVAINSPLGPCPRQHSEAMKDRLRADKEYMKYKRRYQSDTLALLRRLVDNVDAQIRRDNGKLNAGVSCSKETQGVVEGHITARELLVNEKLEAAQKMAAEGDVEQSKKTMEEAEELAQENKRLSRLKEVTEAWIDEVCDVCGAQISWRAPEEIEARKHGRPHPHVMGSWHSGWFKARESLAGLLKEVERDDQAERNNGQDDDGNRDGDRDRLRDRDKDRDRDRRRERDRDREKEREKERERDKERERERERDRDRDRGRDRDRDRDRDGGRDRDRDRDRERDRGRAVDRDRERDKDKDKDKDRARERGRGRDAGVRSRSRS